MKHLLLILISTLWSMAATAQEPGIYVNGDLQEQEVSRETLYQYARTVGVDDSVDVYILPTAEGLEYKTYVSLNEGTWTFHGNGSWISCIDKSNEPLRIHNVNVTFDNLSNEGIDGGAPTLFAGYSTNVTLSDCRLWGVVFKANQGMSTVTFTSGEYWNLRSKQTNGGLQTVIAGGTFYDCDEFFDETQVTFAPGLIFKNPDDDTPLTLNEWGRVADAYGNPVSAFTCVMQPPVVSYVTSTGLSGTFTSMHEAISAFTDTKESMHVDFTLLADISPESRLRFAGMDVTLNLGSHRITFDNEPGGGSSYHFVCVNGDLTLNADEGGGMDFHVPSPENSNIFGLGVIDGATMTITSGSYRGNGIIVISYGTVNISGGTFHSVDEPAAYWREGKANISGGRFTTSNNKWAAIYSNGKSLVDGYSYWIHDYSGAPAETYDIYKSYFGGYVYNIFDDHAGRDVSVGEQSTFARLTANGISARYTNLAKAFEDAQKYESATITLEGGNLIGCRESVVIEGGNITFDYGKRTTLFTFNCDEPTITITGGTLTVRGDEDEYWCESSDLLFWVTDSGTLNVESGQYVSDGGSALYGSGDSHINISGGLLYSESPDHCTVDLRSKHANITGGIFYNADGYCSLYSSEPCMSDELSFYYVGNIDPEEELSFTPGDYLATPNGSPVYYAVVAPSTGPRFTVTAHDGSATTTQKFYSFEKALAFATEHESAHIDVHQHDYKWGAYRMDKGNVTIDLHGNYINSLYDIYFSNEPQFSDYLQHTVDYGAIVVSGGHLTINADNSNSWNIYSDVGCIVATGTSTIELNGVNTWSDLGIDIVASGRSTITVCGGSHHANYTIQSLTDSRYGSATVAAINEGYISIFDGTFEGLNTLYSDNSGEYDDDDDFGIMYGSNISVYGGRFKGLAHRPAVTLHDGLLLCGGRYSCDSGQSAIAYPGERIYESWWRFIGEGYPPRDYYSGERLEMEVDRNDNGRVVFYTDSTQTAYANDIYLSMKPIFQIQHLTHIIDEAKKGRASISDVESMVQKVLKK